MDRSPLPVPAARPTRSRRAVSSTTLPAEVAAAVNRRAFALARELYPRIQNDLQALAWDLIEQGQSAHQVAEAVALAER